MSEVPPPRYTEEAGWKRLVCDEQEWLARPASWGLGVLPDETRGWKQKLLEQYMNSWLADQIRCEKCRPFIRRSMTDDEQLSEQLLDEWRAVDHPDDCDASLFRLRADLYHRGLVAWSELFDHFISGLYTMADPRRRDAKNRALSLELAGPNPFRPITFAPGWRTDTAVAIARGMYEARDFGAMPILADALQDAGCDSDDILAHCRDATAAHVRGCWVVDLVLGKA